MSRDGPAGGPLRRRRRRALVGAVTMGALAATFVWAADTSWVPERVMRVCRGTGWMAAGALLLSLSSRPTSIALRWAGRRWNPAPARRQWGIVAALCATLHAVLSLSTYLVGTLDSLWDIAWLRAGVLGWLILLALGATSSRRVNRALRLRHWKALHRLAYVAGGLALQHALLAPMSQRAVVLGVFGAALAWSLLRLWPTRRGQGNP